MQALIERPLKVLTESHRSHVANFNRVCRELQRLGIRLHCIDLVENHLDISPEDGARLLDLNLVCDYQRRSSAGSTHYRAYFQGVEITWSAPISFRDYVNLTDIMSQ